ncbi:MAG: RsmE family RNA methyltransferase [Bacteroidetes bacterium]|nr:RsmE family RNA methyltransferase [Bacteroidota bacterium]
MKDALRLYVPQSNLGESFDLNQGQQQHLRVLRLSSGDRCEVFDGRGRLCEGILKIEKRTATILIDKLIREEEQENQLTIAVAPTKNVARFEWLIEQTTELGVCKIIPFVSAHSERTNLNSERLERVVESAAGQSKELWLPEISALSSFEQILTEDYSERWIAHCQEDIERISLETAFSVKGDHIILIGPEGDFSKEEILEAQKIGFQSISLGRKRLRTETAAMAVALAYSIFNS